MIKIKLYNSLSVTRHRVKVLEKEITKLQAELVMQKEHLADLESKRK